MKRRTQHPTPFGQFLKELRERKGVSLRDVEEATEISNAYLSQLETGARRTQKLPPVDTLRRLADYFNVTMMELLQRAGYLEEKDIKMTLEKQIDKAYEHVRHDPNFKFGTRITSEPSLEMKRFIVEIYERATKRKLL